jgi:molybdopterin synthase catalytic subunit/molybdopterin synthase sulfur carrier subunit
LIVRVVPFARIREIVGFDELARGAPDGSTAGEVWDGLAREFPALAPLGASTRLVRNGAFVPADALLAEGDELGLLPPYGGG